MGTAIGMSSVIGEYSGGTKGPQSHDTVDTWPRVEGWAGGKNRAGLMMPVHGAVVFGSYHHGNGLKALSRSLDRRVRNRRIV